jgi:hypothetical protein
MKPLIDAKVLTASALLWLCAERSFAVDIEPMGKAIGALLGTTKQVQKKTFGKQLAFFSKDASAKGKAVFIENGVYEPNCAHTWAVGIDGAGKVQGVRVLSLGCPHANPIKPASFLDQYKGKGAADIAALKAHKGIDTIAKATGSCDLTSDAVARSLESYVKNKAQLQ